MKKLHFVGIGGSGIFGVAKVTIDFIRFFGIILLLVGVKMVLR